MEETLEEAVPNVVAGYTQPIQMRVEELISGVRATLALKLYGEDLAELDRISGELKNVLATVPGVADLSLEANLGKPQIRIKVEIGRAHGGERVCQYVSISVVAVSLKKKRKT